eukprot:scaffold4840_cov115-Isochrysis_galbana.AAC.12
MISVLLACVLVLELDRALVTSYHTQCLHSGASDRTPSNLTEHPHPGYAQASKSKRPGAQSGGARANTMLERAIMAIGHRARAH